MKGIVDRIGEQAKFVTLPLKPAVSMASLKPASSITRMGDVFVYRSNWTGEVSHVGMIL